MEPSRQKSLTLWNESHPPGKPTSLTVKKLLLESNSELGFGIQVYLKGIRNNMDMVLWEDLEGAGGEGGGRGGRDGKTCKLKAVSFQCMTKFTTN